MTSPSHPVGANVTILRGTCPPPFLEDTSFTGKGHVDGRLCAPNPQIAGTPMCCLPCPVTDWIYPQNFVTWYRVAECISTVGLVMCIFLLLSWAVLPPSKTRRHYLSICLVIGIIMEALAFVIPLGVRPPQCYDEITPNDMYSNLTCAFSGAFIVGGGLVVTVWAFIRSLSMHLQICWDIVPGNWFFYASQAVGWGIAAVLFTVTMTITGVSFRFGDTCHVNQNNSMGDFWGPLLGISIAAALVQILTFLYCIKVYLRNVWSDNRTETNGSSGLPSYHSSSVRTASARAVYQRVKKVLWLQWRSITIVFFLLIDIIFFAIVWVQMDNALETAKNGNLTNFMPYLTCLLENGSDREKCFASGQKALINESTAVAILMLLSLTGVQTALMMVRRTMFSAWWDLFKGKFGTKREFVSLDATKDYQTHQPTQFELLKVGSPTQVEGLAANTHDNYKDEDSSYQTHISPTRPDRPYRKPTMSFSGPRSPSATPTYNPNGGTEWAGNDDGWARGGLGHPDPATTSPSFRGRNNNYDTKAG